MRRLLATASLLTIAALLLISCDDETTGPGGGGGTPVSFPLGVGNTWIYNATNSARGGEIDTSMIIGTDTYKGQMYYVLDESGDDDGVLLRQDGQALWVVPPLVEEITGGERGEENPSLDWLADKVDASLPWRYAQFDTDTGASWTLAAADTMIDFGKAGGVMSVSLAVTASNEGRSSVTVPAGTFDDCYLGEIVIAITAGGAVQNQATQHLWVKDGVGLVRQTNEEVELGDPTPSSDTDELVSYSVN